MFSSVSFAKSAASKSITSGNSDMRIGFGSYIFGPLPALGGGSGYAQFRFKGDTYTGGAGLNYWSTSNANNTATSFGAMGQIAFNITGGLAPTHIGAGLNFNSLSGGSSFALAVLYGAETIVANNILIGFDLVPLTFVSMTQAGATTSTFALGSAAVYGSYLFN